MSNFFYTSYSTAIIFMSVFFFFKALSIASVERKKKKVTRIQNIFVVVEGMSFATRQVGNLTKPKVVVNLGADGVISVKAESALKTVEVKFKLNEECDETTADGRKAKVGCHEVFELFCFFILFLIRVFIFKSLFTLENGKLVQTQSWDGKTTTLEREIQDDGKRMTVVSKFTPQLLVL